MSIYLSKFVEGAMDLKDKIIFTKDNINFDKNEIKIIGILNLMPNKIDTENQLLKILNDTDERLFIKFIRLKTYQPKNISIEYLKENYYLFEDIKNELDGVIITGAPVEKLEFNEVEYIKELKEILDYIRYKGISSICICWAAQAALNHFYGIRKVVNSKKIFGVYKHKILNEDKILNGIKDGFKSPHSRYTSLIKEDLYKCTDIKIISTTEDSNEHIVKGSFNDYYIFGHSEYDKYTLKKEYLRDINSKLEIQIPYNYFINDDPNKDVILSWKETSIKLYKNWVKNIVNI